MVQLTGSPIRTARERLRTITNEPWTFAQDQYLCHPPTTTALDVISEKLADRGIVCSGISVGHKRQITIPRDQTDRILDAEISLGQSRQ